ncbi:MAG: TfuA-like protein, partial [Pseudomonadota bacterium]
MKAVVFVGPSLPGKGGLDPSVEVRPPAAAGDLYRAVRSGADLIALIDARFEDRLTVLHQEILFALSEGVHVWGAASMGALRAVECGPFGMRGFGRIYEMYRDGVLEDDHEVAVLYGPAELGFLPLTVPLVSVRATMADAVAAGLLGEPDAQAVTDIAQDTHYKNLTWEAVLASLPAGMAQEPLAEWLKTGAVDLKARDAEQ